MVWQSTGQPGSTPFTSILAQGTLSGGSAITVPIGSSISTAILPAAAFNSYNMITTAYEASQVTGSAYTMGIGLTWFADPAGALPLGSEDWQIWVANSAGAAQVCYATGPVRGPYFQITFFNIGSTAITVPYIEMWGSPAVVVASDWRQNAPAMSAQSGYTNNLGNMDVAANVLEQIGLSAVTSTLYFVPFGLGQGSVWSYFQASTALTAAMAVNSTAKSGLIMGNLNPGTAQPGVIWSPGNTAGTGYQAQYIAGRGPLYAVIDVSATSTNVQLNTMLLGKT